MVRSNDEGVAVEQSAGGAERAVREQVEPNVGSSATGAVFEAARSFTYVPELTGLRAVAIGLVLLEHNLRVFHGGFIGVDIFFVLSGFLITTLLVREYQQWGAIKLTHFYARRILRLGPALAIMLAVYLLIALISADNRADHMKAVLISGTYMMDWSQSLNHGPPGYLTHTWTLGVEEQFYLFWPLILIVALRYKLTIWKVLVSLIIAVTLWRGYLVYHTGNDDAQRTYLSFDTRIDTLLFGCLIAVAPLQRLRAVASRFPTLPLVIFALLALVLRWDSASMNVVGFTLVAALAAWLLVGAMSGSSRALASRFLRFGPVEYLGRISYGVYLWSLPIGLALANPPGTDPHTFRAFLLTCVLTVSAAAISYHFVEQPILSRRRFTRTKPAPADEHTPTYEVVRRFPERPAEARP